MKGTENFKGVIQKHLEGLAASDPLFAETLKKKNKSIDSCITYILNTVKASGCNGFDDAEIFNMATHYYDEDNIKVGEKTKSTVVINHSVELTPEEIQNAKQAAIDKVIQEQREKMTAKRHPITAQQQQKQVVNTLFD